MFETLQEFIHFLIKRKQAYLHVFNPRDQFVQIVLKDLAHFCRGDRSTFDKDPQVHALLEGRREVFLRIMEHTKMNQDDFFEKYKIKPDLIAES